MRVTFLALISLVFLDCGLVSSFKIRDAFLNEQVLIDSFKREIPFQEISGVIIIKVTIDGIEEDFIFDTAATTKIDSKLAKRLKYTSLGKKKTFDSNNNKRNIKYVALNRLEVGGVPFASIVATISDLDELNKNACLEVAGILGVNVMNKGVWQIDYTNQKIRLTDHVDSLKLSGNENIVNFYSTGKGTPEISLYADGAYLGEAALDTGFNGGIALNETKSINHSDYIEKQYYVTGTFSSMENKQKMTRTPSLGLGSTFKVSNPIVTLVEQKMSYNLIGTRFLENYITTIDWNNQQLFLDQAEDVNESSYHGFGIHPRLSNDEITIGSIYLNSPAYKQGIRINDKILKINDVVFDKDNHKKYCELRAFLKRSDVESISVVIQRGEDVLNCKLLKFDLMNALRSFK